MKYMQVEFWYGVLVISFIFVIIQSEMSPVCADESPEIKALNRLLKSKILDTERNLKDLRTIENNPEPIIPILVKALSKDRKNLRPKELSVLGVIGSNSQTRHIAERVIFEAIKEYPVIPRDKKNLENKIVLLFFLIGLDTFKAVEHLKTEIENLPEDAATRVAYTIATSGKAKGKAMLSELFETSKGKWVKHETIKKSIKEFREKQSVLKESKIVAKGNKSNGKSKPVKGKKSWKVQEKKGVSTSRTKNNSADSDEENVKKNSSFYLILVGCVVGLLVMGFVVVLITRKRT